MKKHHTGKRKTEIIREQTIDLVRNWEVLDKRMSDLRTQILLKTNERERLELQSKQHVVQQELGAIDRQLDALEAEYQKAVAEEQRQKALESAREKTADTKTALLKKYLRWLYEQCGRLSLGGIDRKAAASRDRGDALHLDSVYTALLTTSGPHKEMMQTEPEDAETGERGNKQLSALEQLNRNERLVLLGEPGSGKSTFINFVTMCLAGQWLTELKAEERRLANLDLLRAPLPIPKTTEPQEWEHWPLVPVRVILRDFAARALPPQDEDATAEHLWDFLQKELEDAALPEFGPYLKEFLQEKGGILLFDGLDEVPEAEARRRQISQVVQACSETFGRCRIVVTSRTYAYQKQGWRLEDFRESVLAKFSESQIRYFVEHWYHHIGPLRGMTKKKIAAETKRLQEAIFSSERLSNFAERPLLLTLMASLHAWRGGSLPEKREELYNDTVDLLLEWWESRKLDRPESLTELLQVRKGSLRQSLNTLALEAHKNQPDLAGTADIAEKDLVSRLMHLSHNRDLGAVELVKYLSERSGLLIPRGVGVYTFPHRTFQEYLAACALTDSVDFPDNVAELGRRDPNRWREVVLLAAAKAARGAAASVWMLSEALCFQDPPANAEDAWGALLAGQILVESANLKTLPPRQQPKLERIRRWLVAILTEQAPVHDPLPAVERALAGRLLAKIGDPRPGVGLREDGLPDIEWCEVPEGTFLMGSDPEKDPDARDNEQPQHEVFVSAFQISRYPVTNAQFQAFVNDGGYTERWRKCWSEEGWEEKQKKNWNHPEKYENPFNLSNHPVVGISWYESFAFCYWLTEQLQNNRTLNDNEIIRLPSEAEWEYAARGTDARIRPWGDKFSPEYANYSETNLASTSAVGCFPKGKSPFGCMDMAGNGWEWCWDIYQADVYKQLERKNPVYFESSSNRIRTRTLRGGIWLDGVTGYRRTAFRTNLSPSYRTHFIEFRLLKTIMG